MAGAADVVTRVGDRTLTLTNLEKVLYPSVGLTKAEVIDYYLRIAPVMLPYIRDRVMTRLRFPDGVSRDRFSFYEKNAPMGTPDWVRRVNVSTSDGIIDYVVADDEAAVVWLANLAALEMHVPQWTVSSATAVDGIVSLPEADRRPGEPLADRVVVDLDPGAGMTIVDSSRAALIVAARLAEDGMIPIAQTSGSKGIQVYAAIAPTRSKAAWAYVKQLNASPAQGAVGFLRRDHVRRATGRQDLCGLQPEFGGAQHDRAVLDAGPGTPSRRHTGQLGGTRQRTRAG